MVKYIIKYHNMKKQLLTELEAIEYLREIGLDISLAQLRRYRSKGYAPRYLKNVISGRVRYPSDELQRFAQTIWRGPTAWLYFKIHNLSLPLQ